MNVSTDLRPHLRGIAAYLSTTQGAAVVAAGTLDWLAAARAHEHVQVVTGRSSTRAARGQAEALERRILAALPAPHPGEVCREYAGRLRRI
ncbi:hypothetical protein ACFV0R_25695 [Streptomyces sp. NPDC059578]|uniref:hypothetical protein n=1 Tax=Streptomyces sp. NPDC059578 TaxID=3346874 RepID=UPI0036B611B5